MFCQTFFFIFDRGRIVDCEMRIFQESSEPPQCPGFSAEGSKVFEPQICSRLRRGYGGQADETQIWKFSAQPLVAAVQTAECPEWAQEISQGSSATWGARPPLVGRS